MRKSCIEKKGLLPQLIVNTISFIRIYTHTKNFLSELYMCTYTGIFILVTYTRYKN